MKKLHPLLSVLFLIYWGCDKKPERKEISKKEWNEDGSVKE